ncbi:MAG: hypothetical protein F4Y02_17660 [Chloroflexi bacterium]|nr:hypothetical protein [Rhodospirillales bacterium]MYD95466.1 hypothetical protein [Chloroflexota bacterium]
MAHTVFYSWQSDLPETRNVIGWALQSAVRDLNRECTLEEARRVDQDTAGIAGWPDIASTILSKIETCEVFVADLTPINGPKSKSRLTPNPNVMLELGYALATGIGRTRIVCVVNDAYLPEGDLKELPFDVRGSRPIVFRLADAATRGAEKGLEDAERSAARRDLAGKLARGVRACLNAIAEQRANQLLGVRPHLATDGEGKFQFVMAVQTAVPFQVKYLVTEPGGNLLSGLMMSPAKVNPEERRLLRFRAETLKPLTKGNDTYVLSGEVAHLSSDDRPVPRFHPFEVRYRLQGNALIEISRTEPPVH